MMKKGLTILFFLFFSITNSQIVNIGLEKFLNKSISKNTYTISSFYSLISKDKAIDFHTFLSNIIQFKYYFDEQKIATNIYAENCKNNSTQIKLGYYLFSKKYETGINIASYVFNKEIYKKSEIKRIYTNKINEDVNFFKSTMNYDNIKCYNVENNLALRLDGFFGNEKTKKNVYFVDNILSPSSEFTNKHIFTYNTIHNQSNSDFYLRISIPISWVENTNIKKYSNSIVGKFEPFCNFTNSSIQINIVDIPNFIKKTIPKSYSDKQITELIYKNKKFLSYFAYSDNQPKSDLIYSAFFQLTGKIFLYSKYKLDYYGKIFKDTSFEYLRLVTVRDNKIILITAGSTNSKIFNAYKYYSKLFYLILNSATIHKLDKNVINLVEYDGLKFLPLKIGSKKYKFLVDTGANDIIINNEILNDLKKIGLINNSDFLGTSKAILADGSIVECKEWNIPKINIFKQKIKNLKVLVINSSSFTPIFGINGLKKLSVEKFDINNNKIILTPSLSR